MPAAGDEGSERTVICPYDRAHEIRVGRMQFHLKKCRQNFPVSSLDTCPFNSLHRVPQIEMAYHVAEDCSHRNNWERWTHDVGDIKSPVADLVPVTAGFLPECEENWENEEVTGSVLQTIQAEAEKKPLLRYAQCVSKSQRKNFRKEQREKFALMGDSQKNPSLTATSDFTSSDSRSFAGSKRQPPEIPHSLNSQFHKLDLNSKPLSDFPSLPSPPQAPFQPSDNYFPSLGSTKKGNTQGFEATKNSFAYSPSLKSADAEEFSPVGNSFPTSMNYANAWSRPSTAMSLAMSSQGSRPASVLSADTNRSIRDDDGFCPLPVPGLGRGRKAKK